jgi:5-methylcytosine-specific restriction endonuclease McrA
MRPVSPNSRTCLALNASYMPSGYFTARAAIRHLLKGTAKALDAHGNLHDWDSWQFNSASYWNDPVCLRTKTTAFCVPTILIISRNFGVRRRPNRASVSLRALYKIYRGQCQYCLEKIPYAQATRDHVYPQSKGGSNDDFNLVLSCKRCNSTKSDMYPYHNADGKEVRPIKMHSFYYQTLLDSRSESSRPEWSPFLIVKH